MDNFAQHLKRWRTLRRLSQLELALRANVSARHTSFLESGRAAPSRDMVHRLARALELPLAESNALFNSAGFAPAHSHFAKPVSEMPQIGRAINFILQQQLPYPAIVVDGQWNIIQRNRATQQFFAPFHEAYDAPDEVASNAMLTVFHPGALRQFMPEWDVFASAFLQLLVLDSAVGNSAATALLQAIQKFPGVDSLAREFRPPADQSPLMQLKLCKGDYCVAFFSTFTRFAMPNDVSAEQIKIECFFPADEATERWARTYDERP
jgi:transcriptional regulator with XRE-family HTH domain